MIYNFKSLVKTNSYIPKEWEYDAETIPFPAYRGESHCYDTFLAVSSEYIPKVETEEKIEMEILPNKFGEKMYYLCNSTRELTPEQRERSEVVVKKIEVEKKFNLNGGMIKDMAYSKISKTRAGNLILLPCTKEEDEQIMLITAMSSGRKGIHKVVPTDCEILYLKRGYKHCVETLHAIVRAKKHGFIYIATNTEKRNHATKDIIEVFDPKLGYKVILEEKFPSWAEGNKPNYIFDNLGELKKFLVTIGTRKNKDLDENAQWYLEHFHKTISREYLLIKGIDIEKEPDHRDRRLYEEKHPFSHQASTVIEKLLKENNC